MIKQTSLDPTIEKQKEKLRHLIKRGTISLAGNHRLKIYGKLSCASGKRLKPQNRIFFKNESEAKQFGYRPCGNCMPEQFYSWKISLKSATGK